MHIQPLWDRVLLRVIREDNRSKSGLYVPDIAFKNSPLGRAEVLACGPGTVVNGEFRATVVKPGDIVWYAKPRAEPIPYNGEKAGDVVMVVEDSIVAVLTELDVATSLVTPSGDVVVIEARPS